MEDARLDLGYRDHCAHLLIPLNECRLRTSYMPWQCQDLRHAYEKCQYDEYEPLPRRPCCAVSSQPTDARRWALQRGRRVGTGTCYVSSSSKQNASSSPERTRALVRPLYPFVLPLVRPRQQGRSRRCALVHEKMASIDRTRQTQRGGGPKHGGARRALETHEGKREAEEKRN